jgi:hypothetical protein
LYRKSLWKAVDDSRDDRPALAQARFSWRTFLLYACPTGAATGLDIAFSNLSFLYVTVSFYVMVKPAGLLWTLRASHHASSLAISTVSEQNPLSTQIIISCRDPTSSQTFHFCIVKSYL